MINLLKAFGRDEAGAAAAEYALILAVVGAAIATAAAALSVAISDKITAAAGIVAAAA